MRAVYVYDPETKKFIYPRVFEDNDNTVIPNSTTVPVPDDIWGDKIWDGQAWHGMTKEEYLKANPPKPMQSQGPSQESQAMNALGLQVAKLQKQNEQLSQSINLLGLQIAQGNKKEGN